MKRILKWFAIIISCLAAISVALIMSLGKISAWWVIPADDFNIALAPNKANYKDISSAWAAHPDKDDEADLLLKGFHDNQELSDIDVFFVHPTGFYSGKNWNSDMAPDKGAAQIICYMLAGQTSMFNHCCRIFAPHFRETNIRAFVKEEAENGIKALSLAYSDVLSAFDYFIANEIKGRPFILTSHSQGTYHLSRLLKDRIDKVLWPVGLKTIFKTITRATLICFMAISAKMLQ